MAGEGIDLTLLLVVTLCLSTLVLIVAFIRIYYDRLYYWDHSWCSAIDREVILIWSKSEDRWIDELQPFLVEWPVSAKWRRNYTPNQICRQICNLVAAPLFRSVLDSFFASRPLLASIRYEFLSGTFNIYQCISPRFLFRLLCSLSFSSSVASISTYRFE